MTGANIHRIKQLKSIYTTGRGHVVIMLCEVEHVGEQGVEEANTWDLD